LKSQELKKIGLNKTEIEFSQRFLTKNKSHNVQLKFLCIQIPYFSKKSP